RYLPRRGDWEGRDVIFLSEGHACPVQYLINAQLGYYSREEVFEGNRRPFTPFQGHTQRSLSHGLENSNGSLGIGLWQAYGFALEWPQYVFCITGDGEFEEPASLGLLIVPHQLKPLPNFILLLNYNRLAQDSLVDLGPIGEVARLYGWSVMEVDGHDFIALGEALHQAVADRERPKFIICHTVKGKGGDPEREGKLGSHGKPPANEEEFRAYKEGLEKWWRELQ
ncbi:MAG: transketolase, partial [bacterium]